MELKTLKDIDCVCHTTQDGCCSEPLKQDIKDTAIEWYAKLIDGKYCWNHGENHLEEWDDKTECSTMNTIISQWIIEFFNITPKDIINYSRKKAGTELAEKIDSKILEETDNEDSNTN